MDSGTPRVDSGSPVDSGTPRVDAGTDAGTPTTCDRTGFTAAAESAEEDATVLVYQGQSNSGAPFDALSVELYYELGASTSPFTFSAWENYSTCSTCVLVATGCDGTSGCMKVFEVYEGELNVSVNENADAPGRFAATLTGARAREVTIDPDTFESTPVPGGESWCLNTVAIDLTTTLRM